MLLQHSDIWHSCTGRIITLHTHRFTVIITYYNKYYTDLLTELETTGLEYASVTSYYKKIIGTANNYTYYASKCTGQLSLFTD